MARLIKRVLVSIESLGLLHIIFKKLVVNQRLRDVHILATVALSTTQRNISSLKLKVSADGFASLIQIYHDLLCPRELCDGSNITFLNIRGSKFLPCFLKIKAHAILRALISI